jgi:hypothetical protein
MGFRKLSDEGGDYKPPSRLMLEGLGSIIGSHVYIRSSVERFFGWLKSFRSIVISYGRLAITYRALINIPVSRIIKPFLRSFNP